MKRLLSSFSGVGEVSRVLFSVVQESDNGMFSQLNTAVLVRVDQSVYRMFSIVFDQVYHHKKGDWRGIERKSMWGPGSGFFLPRPPAVVLS